MNTPTAVALDLVFRPLKQTDREVWCWVVFQDKSEPDSRRRVRLHPFEQAWRERLHFEYVGLRANPVGPSKIRRSVTPKLPTGYAKAWPLDDFTPQTPQNVRGYQHDFANHLISPGTDCCQEGCVPGGEFPSVSPWAALPDILWHISAPLHGEPFPSNLFPARMELFSAAKAFLVPVL